MWWLSISEIDSLVSIIRKKISYRKHIHHNPSSKDVERRKKGSIFCETTEPFPKLRTNRIGSIKSQRWKVPWLNNEIYSFCSRTNSILPVSLFAVRNLILKCLTGSHMTILSKSNYQVRLNVNMDTTDSISFYFNFENGCYFVLRLKQHFLDKARFFLNE